MSDVMGKNGRYAENQFLTRYIVETSNEGYGVVVFRGLPGEPCEEFIRCVRGRAFSEGKQRDNEWICDFASTCFTGRALRWYEELDEEIQQDWKLLRQALLRQYPPADDSSFPPR